MLGSGVTTARSSSPLSVKTEPIAMITNAAYCARFDQRDG